MERTKKAKSTVVARMSLGSKGRPPHKEHEKKKKGGILLKRQWSDEVLTKAMAAIDSSYKWQEVCTYYGIPRTSLRDKHEWENYIKKDGASSHNH